MKIAELRKKVVNEENIYDGILGYSEYIKKHNLIYCKEHVTELNQIIINHLINDLSEDVVENFSALPYVFDAIKNKMVRLDDTSNPIVLEERKILREIKKTMLEIYKLYEIKFEKTKERGSYSDIINYFISTEVNYLELKKLVEKYPNIINSKYEGKPIVFHILDLYMDNYIKLLKKEPCISKDYLREIYVLFTSNNNINLKSFDKKEIDAKLSRFENQIKKLIKKRNKINKVSEEINSLKSSNFYLDRETINSFKLRSIDENQLRLQENNIKYNYDSISGNRVDLSKDETICMNSSMYSLTELEDGFRLKFHVLNTPELIPVGSTIDIYLYNCLMTGIVPDSTLNDLITFRKGKKYPTITYDLKVEKNGKISDLNIYKSIVEIKNRIGFVDAIPSCYLANYKRISNNLGSEPILNGLRDLTSFFDNVLSKEVSKYMYENHIPFIYFGSKFKTIKDSISINNDLVGCLNFLNKEELNAIKKLMEDYTDPFHYSTKYLGDDGKYNLSLTNPYSYLNLEYQRIFEEIIFNDQNLDATKISNLKREKKKRNELLVLELNKIIKYLDTEKNLENKQKFITVPDIDKRFKSSKIEI